MVKDGYWKIHDDDGKTMKVGVDLAAVVSADVSSKPVNNEEFSDPHGGGCDGVGNAPKPASFFVYWDQADKKYDVFDPTVITPDGNITAALPESFDTGEEYSCCVTKDPDTGEYSAEIMLSEYAEEEDDAVMSVPLFVINEDGTVDQKHLGSIIVNKGGVTSLKGDDEDSVKVDGDVEIDGGKSGLTAKTELEEQDGDEPPKAKVTIDVKGRDSAAGCENTDNWGCQEVKLPGGGIAHFLGCHPIDLSNVMTKSGGGGGGGDPDDPDDPPDDPDDPDEPEEEKDVIDGTTYVRTIHGETEDSDTVSGDLEIMSAEGSGLVVKTVAKHAPTEGNPNPDGTVVLDLEGRENLPDKCSKNFGLHQIKYKDKNGDEQIYHVFSCGDINLTEMGKLIKNVVISCSAEPGGVNTMVFNYTDGSSDTFKVQNGLNGAPGSSSGGDDPDDPDPGPVYPGDVEYLTEDDLDEVEVVTGARFKIENGKLVANVKKKQIKAVVVKDLSDETVNVCDAKELVVVTGESYDTSSHQFTNARRKITVMGDAAAQGQTPFTATPHSSEA